MERSLPESTTTLRFRHASGGYTVLTADKDGFGVAAFQKFAQCFSGKFGDIVSAEICINFADNISLDSDQSTGSKKLDDRLHDKPDTGHFNALLFGRVTMSHALTSSTGVKVGDEEDRPYLRLHFPQMTAVRVRPAFYTKVCEEQIYTVTVFSDGSYHVKDYTIVEKILF